MLWLWLPLAFLLAVLVAGVAFCALRGLRVYRQLRSLGRGVRGELPAFRARFERAQRELESATGAVERLAAAVERLAESRARLEVLSAPLRRLRPLALGLRLLRAR